MKFQLYTQLINGEVCKLTLKPITTRRHAKDAVLSARAAVAEVGESAIIDVATKVPRKTYTQSLGQTSIWCEKVEP